MEVAVLVEKNDTRSDPVRGSRGGRVNQSP